MIHLYSSGSNRPSTAPPRLGKNDKPTDFLDRSPLRKQLLDL